ncbi:MAG: hypothetical protein WDM76_09845 [Limisphaerales bacterium]
MNTNFKFNWGQAVRIVTTAPENMRPGQAGSVCGMRKLDTDNLYLIEFSDGQAIEIGEDCLEILK